MARRRDDLGPEPHLGGGPIILALGGPRLAVSALCVARQVCQWMGQSMMLVYVSDAPLAPGMIPGRIGTSAEDLGGVVILPVTGDPGREIVRLGVEHACSMIILGLARPERAGLGPVQARILQDAVCPVLHVPPQVRPGWGTGGTVLLPLDGAPSTSRVVPLATDLAVRMQASLELLHIGGMPPPAEVGSLGLPQFIDQPQHEWSHWRREFLARFCTCYWGGAAPVRVHLSVQVGDPGAAILREAEEHQPDLIVLGWHGQLEQDRAATLRQVLGHARWPVLAVRVSER